MEENLKLGAYVRNGSIDDDIARVSEYFPWIATASASTPARSRAASSRCSRSPAR